MYALRTSLRAPATRAPTAMLSRGFMTTGIRQKGPVEAAKEAADKVNHKAGDVAARGLEKSEEAAHKAAKAAGLAKEKGEETKEKVKEDAQATKDRAKEDAELAKDKAEGFKDQLKK